ncbi:hypothetical protein P9609_gp18 [Escherichia phage vB_EcoS_PTXU06]|uniref:Uncharacterized protein n=2 Tax=Dhillonvirus TaxID=1623289 RepID=A0A482N4A7_9CAUD|nr:hypothetical protein P9609_gp18 [Escherichia phage vB_EcoS_PTXU06]YP_010741128.1 hypothetical protein P9610_gp18 [Escherichia phage vB_EcoS_Zar3M]MBO9147481.1 hypothetical protein [Escherichia coli]QBQ80455.1 hypothetical protein PTXU06_00018 [Escherichia phage vB_EcoS_PTXU06]UNY42348.1 hypothetical protein [Escherichia phage vB_EcoS_Zar3M]
MPTLIKETPYQKVWKADDVFGRPFDPEWDGVTYKYMVVDTYHGGVVVLRTNSPIEARTFEVKRTDVECMTDFLNDAIKEFSIKNTDYNRKKIMETEILNWNTHAKLFNRPELVITEKFERRQALANKFYEILEAL